MAKKLDSVRRSLFKEFDDDNSTYSDAKKTTRASIKINNSFIAAALIITAAIAVLSNNLIQTLLKDMSSEGLSKINAGIEWTQANYTDLAQPFVCSILITAFTMLIIYFDSEIPGVCPPTPFSPRKAQQIRYATHKETSSRLGIMVSIGSGIVTFFLLYL